MSFYLLQNMMRQEALKAMASKTFVSLGTVSAYDQDRYLATVEIYPAEDDGTAALQTGWLPIFTPWVGNGWGLFMPPAPGDLVEVHFQEGSQQNGYIALRAYNPNAVNLSVPSGEFWLVHASGSLLKFTNDGKVTLNGNTEIDITAPTLNITVSGAATLTAGSVVIDSTSVQLGDTGGTLTGLINGLAQAIYNTHTHSGVQTGTGHSGAPDQTWSASEVTTNVTAN